MPFSATLALALLENQAEAIQPSRKQHKHYVCSTTANTNKSILVKGNIAIMQAQPI
jgi:hypothetical protein